MKVIISHALSVKLKRTNFIIDKMFSFESDSLWLADTNSKVFSPIAEIRATRFRR